MQNQKTLKTQTNQKQTTKRKIPYKKNGKGRENQEKWSALPIFKQNKTKEGRRKTKTKVVCLPIFKNPQNSQKIT